MEDKLDEYSGAIRAAHPIRTSNHKRYQQALVMVGNRHSKAALVELVNWLLMRAEEAERSAAPKEEG